MAITGFDPGQVTTSIKRINEAYRTILIALTDTNYNSFVNPMGAIWGSRQAVEFFRTYQSIINEMNGDITKIYLSVINAMNGAASNLAAIAGSSWGIHELEVITKPIDVSCVKETLSNGTIGIDLEKATGLLPELDQILQAVNMGLEDTIIAVKNCSGFVGGSMEADLLKALERIGENIRNAFNTIKTEVNQAINDTVATYNQTATNISSSFNGEVQ